MKHKTFWLVVLVLTSMQLIAGNNDLLWDYSSAAPRSNPDNGLYYAYKASSDGFYGVKLNSTGYAYFTKAAVAGNLSLIISPRKSGASVGVKVYTWSGSSPSTETLIKTSETVTSPGMVNIPLTAEENNIYIVRSTNNETTLQVIRFTEGNDTAPTDPSTGGDDQPSEDVLASGACGNIGNNVTWVLSNDGTLTISGSGMMLSYSNADAVPWSSYRASINKVVISENVTSIGNYAFSGCNNLTSVIWNAKNCLDFTSDSKDPFYDICTKITSFVFGCEVEYIPAYLCYRMNNITSVTIPNSVKSIGKDAFRGCSSLTSVVWNAKNCASSSSLSYAPFYYICSQITSFAFGNEVEHIPAYLCYGMNNITSVEIGNSVKSIGKEAFSGCAGLTSVNISDIEAWCNIKFSRDANPLYYAHNLYINDELLTDLVIPNSVTSIGGMAFSGCWNLTSVTIPNSIRTIGNYAFEGCLSLQTVYNSSDLELNFGSTDYGYIAYYATSIVQDGHAIYQKAPKSVKSIYDTDGDGEMEFISDTILYSIDGQKKGNMPTAQKDYQYAYYEGNYRFTNHNNDDYIDIDSWDYCYINVNNSNYDVLPMDLSNAPIQFDANLDGRIDFYSIEDAGSSINPIGTHYFHLRQADGSYLKTQLTILTDTAAINSAMLELWESSSNSGLTPMYWSTMPSISDGWMHRAPKRSSDTDESLQPLMMRRATAATTLAYADFTSIDTSIDLDRNGLLDLKREWASADG